MCTLPLSTGVAPWGALALLIVLGVPAVGRAQEEPKELAAKARALLQTHCYRCHGQDGANEGGVNYILDRDKLVERKKVVPGAPEKSRLFKRLSNPNDPMPPIEQKDRPSSEDIVLLRAWIAAGAP